MVHSEWKLIQSDIKWLKCCGWFVWSQILFSSFLCPSSSLFFLLFLIQNHRFRLPLLKKTTELLHACLWIQQRKALVINLPFFFVFLSLSLSADVWNIDAEPELDFFFNLVDFVSSSLSSLSDLAAVQYTSVKCFSFCHFNIKHQDGCYAAKHLVK